ncbi:MAG: hypothetical protein ABSG93_12905 [Solirubrobacteraceae bacterium]|jgi:hypothetical protein
MYHIELRQFPHNVCRFNLSGQELGAVVAPWVSEQFVEVGERKWRTDQARLTILEGPQLGMDQLTMGRGWRAAERQSVDVTERLLAEAKQALAGGVAVAVAQPAAVAMSEAVAAEVPRSAAASASQPAGAPLADPLALGVQLASLLGEDPAALLAAWREVAARASGLAPSESLALAERELRAGDGPGGQHGR